MGFVPDRWMEGYSEDISDNTIGAGVCFDRVLL